jgi:hypothetical protein
MYTLAHLSLRIGVAFAFLYPPIDAISNPETWLGYFPQFVTSLAESAGIPDLMLLHAFGFVEVVIALWILSGWRIFWPSAAATALLLAIVVFDWSEFEILFRDLSIAAASLSLALAHYDKEFGSAPPAPQS